MFVLEEDNRRILEVGTARENYPEETIFPTDYFDEIRVAKLPDAETPLLSELYRSLKPLQRLLIGKLTMATSFYAIRQMEDLKFQTMTEDGLLILQKPQEKRVQILVPPGIGDSYWSMVKLQSFLAQNNITVPDVTLLNEKAKSDDMRMRAVGFIEMFPFVHARGATTISHPRLKTVWHEAYMIRGRRIFKEVPGYDYFMCFNGHLRYGAQLENIEPGLACNWHPPMFVSLEQRRYYESMTRQYSPYFVCYFPLAGSFTHWTKDFSIDKVALVINTLADSLHMRPLIIGAAWDRDYAESRALCSKVHDGVNLMGETNVPKLFGVLKGAEFVIGYPSGPSMMAATFGIKTLLVWSHFYNKDFAYYCVPPDVRRKTYFADWTYKLTAERLVAEALELAATGTIREQAYPFQVPDGIFRYQTTKG